MYEYANQWSDQCELFSFFIVVGNLLIIFFSLNVDGGAKIIAINSIYCW